MFTSQKHHHTNKPTSQYSFIIAYVAILMAREGTIYDYAYTLSEPKFYTHEDYLFFSTSLIYAIYCLILTHVAVHAYGFTF